MSSHTFTVEKLRDKIIEEAEKVGVDVTNRPVEVWTAAGGREFAITDVVFDDGVISIEVREVQ